MLRCLSRTKVDAEQCCYISSESHTLRMFLCALGNVVPEASLSQLDCFDILKKHRAYEALSARGKEICQLVLTGDNGITHRQFCTSNYSTIPDMSSDELNEYFRQHAPMLGSRALHKALAQGGLAVNDIDALVVCTCTGYICPGISSYLSQIMGIKPSAFMLDLVGQGCGAAIPSLRAGAHRHQSLLLRLIYPSAASGIIAANPDAVVAVCCVEICSASWFLDNDIGVIISALIFGDGASASIWSGKSRAARCMLHRQSQNIDSTILQFPLLSCGGFNTMHKPDDRDKLHFEHKDGKLRNVLHKSVPELSGQAVAQLFMQEVGGQISRVVSHTGGSLIIMAMEQLLPQYSFAECRAVMNRHGNMSSPSVMFVLEEMLKGSDAEQTLKQGDWWMVSFGAGFTCHSCRLTYHENQ